MKNKDLSNAIGNINLKYVEEAENFTAKRMSLTKIISLAACIAIIATSIPLALVLNREDAQTDAPVNTNEITTPIVVQPTDPDNTNKNPLKIVYCDASLKEVFKGSSLDIEIRDSSEIDLDLSSKVGEIEAGAEIPAKLYYTIGGKDLICTFDTAYATKVASSTSANLKELANVARYKIESSEYDFAHIEIYCDTGLVKDLDLFDIEKYAEVGNLTESEAKSLAGRDLSILYGESFGSTYIFERAHYDTNDVDIYKFNVSYRRYVHGFPTDDTVRVYYNMKGELVRVVTSKLNTFEGVESKIDAKTIADAKEEALSLIDVENEPVEQMYLTMDIDGGVYWHVVYNRKMDHDTELIIWEYNYKFY